MRSLVALEAVGYIPRVPRPVIPSTPTPGWRRSTLLVASFLGGMVLGCAAIGHLAPFPRMPQVRNKLAAYAAEAGRCDAAFFGSSKINSGIVPGIFDAELEARGTPVRSFNLGIDGMGFLESAYLCEMVLARHPGALRWVFVELAGVRASIPTGQRGSQRAVFWHDARRTAVVARALWRGGDASDVKEPAARREMLVEHLWLFLQRAVSLGLGSAEVADRLQPVTVPIDARLAAERGYRPIQRNLRPKEIAAYESNVAALVPGLAKPGDAISIQALRDFAARVVRAGATPVFVVPPNCNATRHFLDDNDPGMLPARVLAFDRPDRFPTLFQLEYRGDLVHLNDAGARAFTKVLAESFAEIRQAAPDGAR